MKSKVTSNARHYLKAFVPARVLQSRLHKGVFMQFAEKVGMVYFGFVDQHGDEHRLIRGLTVSATHRDNHYCIGSFHGYDITLVERSDVIRFPGKPPKTHDWIIMAFDLHAPMDVPHTFVGLHTHGDTFYAHLFTKFSQLTKVPLGTFETYDPGFLHRYAVYAEPAQAIAAERLFDHVITRTMAEHFGSLTVELADGCLYVYAEHQRPSVALLERMLKYGAWLAESIDSRLEQPAKN